MPKVYIDAAEPRVAEVGYDELESFVVAELARQGDRDARAWLDGRTAHLPGRHDQKSHGRRGGGGDGPPLDDARWEGGDHIGRGVEANPDDPIEFAVADRIINGTASDDELLSLVDTQETGVYWGVLGRDYGTEDIRDFALGRGMNQENLARYTAEARRDGDARVEVPGSVSMVLIGRKPAGWDPAENPVDPLMGNSYMEPGSPIDVVAVQYDAGSGWRERVLSEPRTVTAAARAAHLPGRHDQKTHGYRRGTIGATAVAKARAVEPTVSADMKAAAAAGGGEMLGFDFRLKTPKRLTEKVEKKMAKGMSPSEALASVKDAVRYTVGAGPDHYVDVYTKARQTLVEKGYTEVQAKNYWDRGDAYSGLNTVWTTPGGYTFEVQFHTRQSFDLKESQHDLYEAMQNTTDGDVVDRLYKQQVDAWDDVPIPVGVHGIGVKTIAPRAALAALSGTETRWFLLVCPWIGESEERPGGMWRVRFDDDGMWLELLTSGGWVQTPDLIGHLMGYDDDFVEIGQARAAEWEARFPWPGARVIPSSPDAHVVPRTAHYPGRHDQKSHGNRGRVSVSGRGWSIGDQQIPAEDFASLRDSASRVAAAFPNADRIQFNEDMDPALASEIAEEAEAFAAESPNAAAQITGVHMERDMRLMAQVRPTGVKSSEIVLNSTYYQKYRGISDDPILAGPGGSLGHAVRAGYEDGWHPTTTTTAGIFRHELGHVLDRAGLAGNPPFYPSSKIGEDLGGDYSRVSKYAASRKGVWRGREAFAELYAARNAPTAAAAPGRPPFVEDIPDALELVRFTVAWVGAVADDEPYGPTCEGFVPDEVLGEVESAIEQQLTRGAHLPGHHDQKSHGRRGHVALPEGWRLSGDDRFPGYDVYENATRTVRLAVELKGGVGSAQKISEAARAEAMETLDGLAEKYPEHKVSAMVDDISESRAFGYAVPGTGNQGFFHVSTTAWHPTADKLKAIGLENGTFPPAAEGVSLARYVIVHEYGHTLAPGITRGTTERGIDVRWDGTMRAYDRAVAVAGSGPPSKYGLKNPSEAYAEAFCEFTLSQGRTSDPFSLALAKDQGWVP